MRPNPRPRVATTRKRRRPNRSRSQSRWRSEKDAKLDQKLGQLQPVYSYTPTGMYGPTSIFWANLTAFSFGGAGQRGG
jgi:hypothetical protein